MYRLVDTNILLDSPKILKEEDLIISIKVLKELDGLKRHTNPEIAEKARRAAIIISKQLNEMKFDMTEENIPTDDLLLRVAKRNGYQLITNDVNLKVRAAAEGIESEGYSNKNDYTGVQYLAAEEEETIAKILLQEPTEIREQMRENEYLIIKTKPEQIFKKKSGKLVPVRYTTIENQFIGTLKPRNPEQVCLFDALTCKENEIVYAGGRYGSGKSFLINNYALGELDKERIKKIVYIPNNSYVANTTDIGALPGDILDKTIGTIGPLVDLIGIDRVQKMIEYEKLEIVPMAFARGRSFLNSIIIANEAQNLTEEHIKLLIGRIGEESRLMIDGDIKQADSRLFKNKNGIELMLNLSNDDSPYNKIFSAVKLIKTERSFAAGASEYLDEIG